MFTLHSFTLLSICLYFVAFTGWICYQSSQMKGASPLFEETFSEKIAETLSSRKPERLPPADQASLSLVVAPTKPNRSPASVFANQTDCIDALVSSPMPDDNYMITTECIIFTGTKEECAGFLEDRGIIPFEDTIEPFDIRLQTKMNELGVRVFRRNLC